MTEKLIRKVWIAVSAAILWGCGDASSYTAVDGVMLGTTLHITADVQGVSAQELYAAGDGTRPRSQGVDVDLRSGARC